MATLEEQIASTKAKLADLELQAALAKAPNHIDVENPKNRRCRTCRFWDVHSLDMKMGSCQAPDNHRYWHVRPASGIVALMDSFGPEETKPNYSCHAWRGPAQPLADAESLGG